VLRARSSHTLGAVAFVAWGALPEFGASSSAELWLLFVLVLGDSLGVPAPGDSALIIAGGLAADGRLSLTAVIAVASVAALIGDAIAFEVGRHGGRRVLERDGRFAAHRQGLLRRADRFYLRYGLVAVYVAKFVPGVRAVSAVTAGAAHMPRLRFAAVNALACLSWTALTASVAYALGPTGAIILVAVGVVLSVVAVAVGAWRRRQR
jgi:membrane protein DedA with SNARE-associated domain